MEIRVATQIKSNPLARHRVIPTPQSPTSKMKVTAIASGTLRGDVYMFQPITNKFDNNSLPFLRLRKRAKRYHRRRERVRKDPRERGSDVQP